MFDETIWVRILQYTSSGADYKSFCLVSREWYRIITQLFPKGGKFVNHLLTLIMKQPEKFVHCDGTLLRNPNIPVEDSIDLLRVGNIYEYLTIFHPKITWDMVCKNMDVFEQYIGVLSKHPCVTWDIVQNNPDYDWDYGYMAENPNITWDIIQNNRDLDWDEDMFSYNPNITWDIIENNDDVIFDIKVLTSNPNIPWDVIRDNPLYDWSKSGATERFSWSIIKSNPSFPWVYELLPKNPTITWEDFQEIFTLHPEVKKSPDLAAHPSVTWDIIQTRQDIPWDKSMFSENPNLTWDIVVDNPDIDWDYFMIAANPFRYHPHFLKK